MTFRLRFLSAAALCFSSISVAQSPVVASADLAKEIVLAQLLASPDPKQQAWVSRRITDHHQKQLIPNLRRLLTTANEEVQLHVLDSLIRLHADVPASELMTLGPQFHGQVLILLAMNPAANQQTLHRLTANVGTMDDLDWVAIHNLLVGLGDSTVALDLLSKLTIHIDISVSDPGNIEPDNYADRLPCCSIGRRPPSNDPPAYFYHLTDRPSRDAVLVASGIHPIYYTRDNSNPCSGNFVNRNRYRQEYLAQLVGIAPARLALQAAYRKRILSTNEDDYHAEIEALRSSTEEKFYDLVQSLQKAGMVTIEESENIEPQIEITEIPNCNEITAQPTTKLQPSAVIATPRRS